MSNHLLITMRPSDETLSKEEWKPNLPKPGPQVKELSKFHANGSGVGKVVANGMGPGSPEMDANGRATCEWIQDGLWLSCDFEQDQFAQGEKILTWNAKWIIGWDSRSQEYRAVGVDTNGNSFIFGGRIEGDRLIMESLGDSPVKLRFIWDASDQKAIKWKNEMSIEKGPWQLIEEYVIKPDEIKS